MSCVDKTRTPLTAIKGVNREESAVCTKPRRPVLWNGLGRGDSSAEDSAVTPQDDKEVVVQGAGTALLTVPAGTQTATLVPKTMGQRQGAATLPRN